MRHLVRHAALAGLLALTACAAATEPAGTSRIGPEDLRGGGVWSSGGALELALGLRPGEAGPRLCGAWTITHQSVLSRRHNAEVLASGSVWQGGRRLATGLGFLARLGEGASLEGAQARCIRVGDSARLGGEALSLQLPPRFFEYDELSGYQARFRQTSG